MDGFKKEVAFLLRKLEARKGRTGGPRILKGDLCLHLF